MSAFSSLDRDTSRRACRAGVCVLLIGLLLYNPFAATSAACGLGYQALARHRASVGASEMQHFAPVQVENIHANLSVIAGRGELPAPRENRESLYSVPEHLPLLLGGKTSHWFRPPPRA